MSSAAPHFLHVFSTFVPAGPQVRTARLLAAFGAEFRHTLVAMDGRTDARELLAPGLDVRFVEPPPKAGTMRTSRRMRALVEREAPALVLTYNFGAIDTALAARSLGARHVHHEDGFLPDEAQGFKRRRVWLRRFALRRARAVVVISDNLRRIAVDVWGLAPELVRFIANGIDVASFAAHDGNPALRRELGIPLDAVVVGAVGHLRPEKNLARLLRAVRDLPGTVHAHVLLLGEGPERASLEALARDEALAGRVHFAGYHADPRAHYRAMDVYALSSDTEQMPIALIEAMASGLAVVATDVGDARAMLPREQGPFVVEIGDRTLQEFSAALAQLALSPPMRHLLGRANRAQAEAHFSETRMVEDYRALYRATLATT